MPLVTAGSGVAIGLAAYSEAAVLVAQTIRRYGEAGTPIRTVMLDRPGPNVWHDSPAAALASLEELEETSRLMLLNPAASGALTESQIDELRRTFGARWQTHGVR
jgi:ribulose-5-phosphate 4-epimerase/fuculose-1-phosphate aldolase